MPECIYEVDFMPKCIYEVDLKQWTHINNDMSSPLKGLIFSNDFFFQTSTWPFLVPACAQVYLQHLRLAVNLSPLFGTASKQTEHDIEPKQKNVPCNNLS